MTSIKCAHEANFDGVRESFCDASNFAIDLKSAHSGNPNGRTPRSNSAQCCTTPASARPPI